MQAHTRDAFCQNPDTGANGPAPKLNADPVVVLDLDAWFAYTQDVDPLIESFCRIGDCLFRDLFSIHWLNFIQHFESTLEVKTEFNIIDDRFCRSPDRSCQQDEQDEKGNDAATLYHYVQFLLENHPKYDLFVLTDPRGV